MAKRPQRLPALEPIYEPEFELFYLELQDAYPALVSGGDIQLPVLGLKKALCTAYLRGRTDFIQKLAE